MLVKRITNFSRFLQCNYRITNTFNSLMINKKNYHVSGIKRNEQDKIYSDLEKARNLIWIDLELTGLNIEQDSILEIACLVTNAKLQTLDNGIEVVIHQPESVLNKMSHWSAKIHEENTLINQVRTSSISLAMAESMTLEYIKKHTIQGLNPICGNSVHTDKKFIEKFMPNLSKWIHYRIVDVSSINELCKRWKPDLIPLIPLARSKHRALDDIRRSILELEFYQKHLFKY